MDFLAYQNTYKNTPTCFFIFEYFTKNFAIFFEEKPPNLFQANDWNGRDWSAADYLGSCGNLGGLVAPAVVAVEGDEHGHLPLGQEAQRKSDDLHI